MNLNSHATLAAAPAALQEEKSTQGPDYHFEFGLLYPHSPALTESSASSTDITSSSTETDWVSDIQEAFVDEMQTPEFTVEQDHEIDLVASQAPGTVSGCAEVTLGVDVPDIGQAGNEDLESDAMEQGYESDDTGDRSYLGVLRDLARFQRRATAISELRKCLLKWIPSERQCSSFLAQTPSIIQEEPTQSQNKIEPLCEPTFWTKSGRKFSSLEAARRASAFSSVANTQLQAGATISSTSDSPVGHLLEDMETESELSESDEDTFEIDMEDQMSDDDGESEYGPGTDSDDTGDMDVDSDEDADFEMPSVQWTEARALW